MSARNVLAALSAAAVLALAGCARTAPILNLENVPVTTSSGKSLSAQQVRTTIIAAGTSLGWRIIDAGPGRLEGTLNLRTHLAVVEIPYSARAYSVQYKRSENLNEAAGQIHSNYNGWVQNLDRSIRTELARM
jgi:hypothetical protein